MRWDAANVACCVNGGALASVALTPGLGAPTTLRLGNTAGGTFPLNGRIRLARAYNYAPNDQNFRAMCTQGAPI
jgi:hypothetical protein